MLYLSMSFRHFAAAEPKRPRGGLSDQGESKKPRPSPPAKDIFTACREGDVETVRKHLAAGTDLNQLPPLNDLNQGGMLEYHPTTPRHTPIELAFLNDHWDIVRLLIADGMVNLNHANPDTGETLLSRACQDGSIEIVRILLDDPSVDRTKGEPLYGAAVAGNVNITRLLLQDPLVDPNREGPLQVACSQGHADIVRILLDDPRVDPNRVGNHMGPPLYSACRNFHVDVVRILLDDPRVDPNKPGKNGWTPLMASLNKPVLGDLSYLQLQHPFELIDMLMADKRVEYHKTITVTAQQLGSFFRAGLGARIRKKTREKKKKQQLELARVMHRKQIEEGKGHERKAPSDVLKHIGSFLDHEMKSKLHF